MIEPINLRRMQSIHHTLMHNGVKYRLGAKAKFSTPASSIKAIDCSGLVRYLVYHSTKNRLEIPDGSWNQRDWALKHLTRVPYISVRDNPNELYLATLDPKNGKAGHIWFINDGFTMESHGGRGPNERPWNTPILRNEVDYCFLWPHLWGE
jgi:hypothetical protein